MSAAIGTVLATAGGVVSVSLPGARIGDGVAIVGRERRARGVVATVETGRARVVVFGATEGLAVGDVVRGEPTALTAVLGYGLVDRAIDAEGTPLDGGPPVRGLAAQVRLDAPPPGTRRSVTTPFWTGIRAIDGLATIGAGARVGLFGAPGAGKSTLLETIAAGALADAVVVALVGERGREAQRWIATLREPARAASRTIVCATSDRSAAERIRAAEIAMAQATTLRDRGCHVLLVIDSLARYVAALRERAVALGEPVGRGGYPASVFAALARYLECAGNGPRGTLTTLATVLPDGGDDREPLADACRSLLDGHLVLATALAQAGRHPAIDVVASASRTMADVASVTHRADAAHVRERLALLAETRDLRAAGLADLHDARLAAAVGGERDLEEFLYHRGTFVPSETLDGLAALGRGTEVTR